MIFALLLGLLAATAPVLIAAPAQAAPGDPFNSAAATVYIAQGAPATRLYAASTDGAGTTTFTPVGPASNFTYNAIAYNPADNYIYGIANSAGTASNGAAIPAGAVIRIGQDGHITRVGTSIFGGNNVGVFGADGLFYVMFGNTTTTLQAINPATGTLVSTVTLSTVPVAADFAYKDGFFWGVQYTTGRMVRINPTTGAVSTSAPLVPVATGYGAAWTYGNGNLGFSDNDTGTIYQIQVTNPAAATPTFTVVATNDGPPNGNNDGTSSPGIPTDLAIAKTGPAAFLPGDTLTYTLTVTNNGAGVSTGFVLNDTVPAPLTNVTTNNSAACTVTGNNVRCVGGTLAVGASQTYTITAKSPTTMLACVTNTATVLANEADSKAANNSSSVTSCPSSVPLITCSSDPNQFNTGYNAATGGILADLSKDANWDVAGPFTTAAAIFNVAPSSTATSVPPAGATWSDANVGNIVPTAWRASPYNNAQWISQQTTTNPDQGPLAGDWYYRYNFNLAPSVDPSTFALPMDFYADNSVAEVFVNGIAQGVKNYGTANPYYYAGFAWNAGASATLTNNWQTGLNSIIVQIKSGPPMEGFLAQMRPSVLCPTVTVTKTVASRLEPADQFTVSVADSTSTTLASATTAGTATSATSAVAYIRTGSTYTLTDAMASGTDIGNYTMNASCTGTTTGTLPALSGTGPEWTFTPTVADDYTCTITNTANPEWTMKKDATVDGSPSDGTSVKPGQTITYTVAATSVSGQIDGVVLTDDLSGVLDIASFVPGSAVLVIGAGAPVAVADPVAPSTTLGTEPFTLPAGQVATLEYQVVVNPDAWTEELINVVTGTSTTGDPESCVTGTTPVAEECTTTHRTPAKFLVEKLGESSDSTWVPMAGSSWAVHDDAAGAPGAVNPAYQVEAITAETGLFQIEGIEPGVYWLEEMTAPDGFSLLAEAVQFTVAADGSVTLGQGEGGGVVTAGDEDGDGIFLVTVRDVPALEMPETGGTGSWAFALAGSTLLLAAFALAAGSIRRRRNQPAA